MATLLASWIATAQTVALPARVELQQLSRAIENRTATLVRHHDPDHKLHLENFPFYCRPLRASLNQAFALSGVMHGRASVMA